MLPDLQVSRWLLELAFVVYAVAVTAFVVLERRRPSATLALIMALIFVPVVGMAAYLLFSRQRVRRRLRQRQRRAVNPVDGTRNVANLEDLPEGLPPLQAGLVRLALRTAAAPLRRADDIELLTEPEQTLEAMCSAIRSAQRSVHLEFYIWRDDESGRIITDLLAERARAGVKVRVLYDHLGSLSLGSGHFAALREAGGEVAIFGPLRLPVRLGRSRVNFRNHRKIMTIDGQIGFVGGLNIGDEYLGKRAAEVGWRDLFVRLEGDAVVGLEATFLEDWLSTTGEVVDLAGSRPAEAAGIDGRQPARARPWHRRHPGEKALQRANPFAPLPDRPVISSGPLVQVIPSGPDIPVTSAIAAQFSAAIATAQYRAWIATPYLIPDEPLMLILRTAALRGVDVRILVPEPRKNDQPLVAIASRSYYDELIEVGCRVFEYQPGMLHSKYLIVDEVSAIGSANMDVRSFHINYEITAMFYDAAVTARLAEVFEGDLEQAEEITARSRVGLALTSRLAESFARVLSPLL